MAYEVAFTQGFKDGFSKLDPFIHPVIQRGVKWLEDDPYKDHPRVKALKNMRRTFRMRIGKDLRMLYRVDGKQHRVELFKIGQRDDVYSSRDQSSNPLNSSEIEALRVTLSGTSDVVSVVLPNSVPQDPIVEIETVEWITEDELFLLQIPENFHAVIFAANSIDGLRESGVSAYWTNVIEDYLTNPAISQQEKLYGFASGQDIASVATQPLESFLISLDPEQKAALSRLKEDGPYLLKGSAGTGKSLVGLYHIRNLIVNRAATSLFDKSSGKYGVITYTNTLVGANEAMIKSITPLSANLDTKCSTLDKIVFDLVQKALKGKPNPINTEGMAKWLESVVRSRIGTEAMTILDRLGSAYLADEIEHVIYGNDLQSLDEYLAQKRRGRVRGLSIAERTSVWEIYKALAMLMEERNVQTFEEWRVIAHRYLRDHAEYPRFAALFVDEAQDLSKIARRVCLELVKDSRFLVLAADSGQSIYTTPLTWRECDERFDFQRRKPISLMKSYRATREIGLAVAALRDDQGDEDEHSADAVPVYSGRRPEWINEKTLGHPRFVADRIEALVRNSNLSINPGQIAIIVRDSHRAENYLIELNNRGIDASVLKKEMPIKLKGNAVHIVTAHSSKGLGFPFVFVPEVNEGVYPFGGELARARDEDQLVAILEKERRLLYVALSRASVELVMVVDPDNPSRFLSKVDRHQYWR